MSCLSSYVRQTLCNLYGIHVVCPNSDLEVIQHLDTGEVLIKLQRAADGIHCQSAHPSIELSNIVYAETIDYFQATYICAALQSVVHKLQLYRR